MTSRLSIEHGPGWLYGLLTGEEDARVCKDIPDEACDDQPRNFFAYLCANFLNKISDELVSARLILPWLFSVLGIPVSFASFLVPVREAGVLFPQLFVAAYVRALGQRKVVWLIGAVLSALTLFFMAFVAWQFTGVVAGWLLLGCLVFYSCARGLCSVSAKDVLGKTISKTKRGRLMGYSASLAGFITLVIGILLQADVIELHNQLILLVFIITAGVLWLLACLSFCLIIEPAGATEGGGNAIKVAINSFQLVIKDKIFRKYIISRILLLSVALVIPFYVILIQQELKGQLSVLGWLIIMNGIASSLSAPLIGRFADTNSRDVMTVAAFVAGLVGILIWLISNRLINIEINVVLIITAFFLVTLCHGSVRLGRKVYLVDMASVDNRAQYVAVSNTIIGVAMLFAGIIGVLADFYNVQLVILILSVMALLSSFYIKTIKNVSG